jgi:GTPase
MSKFKDSIQIHIRAGHGGTGSVSFRREKYIARGGPDGGDGGKGGDVYIVADRSYYNLSHFFKDRVYAAKKGKPGQGRNRNGADGEDLYIKVPPGTEIINHTSGEIICDLVEEEKPVCIAKGGIGGKGNTYFKSSVMQTPRFAQEGLPGEEFKVILNFKLIGDVGLVGLPNAGKSTLLSRITNANPKIADYPFTTLTPNLGVVTSDSGYVYKIADIPGIIEGAHKGHGLGLSFLRHIERVKVILYIIEAASEDPLYTYSLLQSELTTYNDTILKKPSYIVISKIDTVNEEILSHFKEQFANHNIICISSFTGYNIDLLLKKVEEILEGNRA